jgi:hypothetical protein
MRHLNDFAFMVARSSDAVKKVFVHFNSRTVVMEVEIR